MLIVSLDQVELWVGGLNKKSVVKRTVTEEAYMEGRGIVVE